MSRRKQAKPRALKHEGDEEDVDGGPTSSGAKNTPAEHVEEDTSDSPMADVSDDDCDDGEDCDVVQVNREGVSDGAGNSRESVSDHQQQQVAESCDESLRVGAQRSNLCVSVARSVEKCEVGEEVRLIEREVRFLDGEVDAADMEAIKCEPQLRNESIHSGELLLSAGERDEVVNAGSDEGEDIDDEEDDDVLDDEDENDVNDDGDNLDVDDEEDDEDDDLPLEGEDDDVDDDDELTSDSFCSGK
ncbi:trigger factor-like [Anopheles ziemanni]|uniref:trigger factor-like n=1 Tax=Anopheles coustani TaxID=139045 RepID=UPI002658E892|nr:trigger factor-like [Anopheles coustani]XP_058170616.1 trigger factor-like [Anopheles ziemanni]